MRLSPCPGCGAPLSLVGYTAQRRTGSRLLYRVPDYDSDGRLHHCKPDLKFRMEANPDLDTARQGD